MSLIYTPVQPVQTQDPRLRINASKTYTIERGASLITPTSNNASSWSDSQIVYQVFLPNKKSVMDRHIRVVVPVTFTATGSASSNLLELSTGMNALRASPVSASATSYNFALNGATFNYNVSDSIHALQWYQMDRETVFGPCSMSPSQLDKYQNYNDGTGASNNPLNSYNSASFFEEPRGALNAQWVVTTNTTSSAVWTATVCEDIFLSPLSFGDATSSGLIGLDSFQLTIQLGDLTRMLSHNSDGNTFTSLVAHILTPPQILVTVLTPQIDEPIPRELSWGYTNVVNYNINVGSVASGASALQQSSSIQLSSIPKLLYVCARRRNADRTYLTSDSYGWISNVNITFNNKTGILSSATPYDLYCIARKNGYKGSWVTWRSFAGSVLCLRVAEDLGLSPIEAPGLAGFSGNLVVTATFTNISSATVNFDLYVSSCVDGVLSMVDGNFFQQVGVLTAQDILMSNNLPILPAGPPPNMFGGNFWDSLKRFGSNVLSGIDKAMPYVQKGVDIAKTIAPLLPMIGLGEDEGGVLMGGKKLKKSALRSRLGHY